LAFQHTVCVRHCAATTRAHVGCGVPSNLDRTEAQMLYPQVTEISRAGTRFEHMVRGQRDLVALSLRVKPAARTTRPGPRQDHWRGVFR
jgi:hypothetical protein